MPCHAAALMANRRQAELELLQLLQQVKPSCWARWVSCERACIGCLDILCRRFQFSFENMDQVGSRGDDLNEAAWPISPSIHSPAPNFQVCRRQHFHGEYTCLVGQVKATSIGTPGTLPTLTWKAAVFSLTVCWHWQGSDRLASFRLQRCNGEFPPLQGRDVPWDGVGYGSHWRLPLVPTIPVAGPKSNSA
jgi:hypothetical protein